MSHPKFISGFANEINRYLDYKATRGYKESNFTFILRQFDRFCAGRGIQDVSFSKEDAVLFPVLCVHKRRYNKR